MADQTRHQPPKDWHAEDIKAAVRKTGISLLKLAERHGYSSSAISMVLIRKSADLQSLIAEHLGIPPQSIWPSRYDELGQPIDGRRQRTIRRQLAAQRQKQEAA
jgi:Ner family transcriptional regulator